MADLIKLGTKSTFLKAAALSTNSSGELRTDSGIIEGSIVGIIPEPHFSGYVGAVGIFGNKIKGIYNHPTKPEFLTNVVDYYMTKDSIFLLNSGSLVRVSRSKLKENLVLFSKKNNENRADQLTNVTVSPDGNVVYALTMHGYVKAWSLERETLGQPINNDVFTEGTSNKIVDFFVGDERRRLFFFNEEGNLISVTSKAASSYNVGTGIENWSVTENNEFQLAQSGGSPGFDLFNASNSNIPIYCGKKYAICQTSTDVFALLDTTTGLFLSGSLKDTTIGDLPFYTTEIRDVESWDEDGCVLLAASARLKLKFSNLETEFLNIYERSHSAIKKIKSGLYVSYTIADKSLRVLDSDTNIIYKNTSLLNKERLFVNKKALIDMENGLFGYLSGDSLIVVNPLLELGGYLMKGGN